MNDLRGSGEMSAAMQPESCRGCAAAVSAGAASGTDRRTFLAQGAAALAALALVACGGASSTAPSTVSSTTINLADQPKLATVGGVVVLSISGTPIAIVRESTSAFSAFSMVCPHEGTTVQPTNGAFYCPGHGAQFALSGTWTGGQRTSNLRSYPLSYDATAGTVTVGG